MAVATSLPELFVGISSAIASKTALSLWNIIGANIINLTLIRGILILLGRGISTKHKQLRESPNILTGIVALPLILFFIGNSISRLDGLILILVFILYTIRLLKKRKSFAKEYNIHKKIKRQEIILTVLTFLLSITLLFISSYFIIDYASRIALNLGLPEMIIGIFLISFGTTLPELTFGARAVIKGKEEMGIGDQLGTIMVNSTLVLGVTALIMPITANTFLLFTSWLFLLFSAFLFAIFSVSRKKLDITEGIVLILLYIISLTIQLHISGIIF